MKELITEQRFLAWLTHVSLLTEQRLTYLVNSYKPVNRTDITLFD